MEKYKNQVIHNENLTDKTEVLNWIDHNLTNHLHSNPENEGEIEHILDYFTARERGCLLRKKSFHLNKMTYNQAKTLAESWVKTLVKKGNNIVETNEDTRLELDLGDGMRLVKLVSEDAFKREGSLMSHCVGSYHDKQGMDIFSLRDANNQPHCTIEVTRDNLNQIKGKGNGSIHPKYIKYMMAVLKHFKKEVRDSEMQHMGYRKLNGSIFDMYLRDFKDLKYITVNGSNFMYIHQKLERNL